MGLVTGALAPTIFLMRPREHLCIYGVSRGDLRTFPFGLVGDAVVLEAVYNCNVTPRAFQMLESFPWWRHDARIQTIASVQPTLWRGRVGLNCKLEA